MTLQAPSNYSLDFRPIFTSYCLSLIISLNLLSLLTLGIPRRYGKWAIRVRAGWPPQNLGTPVLGGPTPPFLAASPAPSCTSRMGRGAHPSQKAEDLASVLEAEPDDGKALCYHPHRRAEATDIELLRMVPGTEVSKAQSSGC